MTSHPALDALRRGVKLTDEGVVAKVQSSRYSVSKVYHIGGLQRKSRQDWSQGYERIRYDYKYETVHG